LFSEFSKSIACCGTTRQAIVLLMTFFFGGIVNENARVILREPGVVPGGRVLLRVAVPLLFSTHPAADGGERHAAVVKFVTADSSRINNVPQHEKANLLNLWEIAYVLGW
jgi:hypothetical protein